MKLRIFLAATVMLAGFISGCANSTKTCVVSGEKLGSMGDPYVFTYEGRQVKLCCDGCLADFKKDPAKYLKKMDEADAKEAQKK